MMLLWPVTTMAGQQRFQRLTRAAKVATKVGIPPLQVLPSLSSLTGALRTMMKRDHCALLISLESASSKDQQENSALVAITSATNVDASDRSLITWVTTQTEARIHVHHRYRIQIHPYLWKFLRDEGPYQKR